MREQESKIRKMEDELMKEKNRFEELVNQQKRSLKKEPIV